jgi:uncharacterized protein
MRIWIDADAAPRDVKELVFRAAKRLAVETVMVANQRLQTPPGNPFVSAIRVDGGADVADRHIAANAVPGDLVITQDVPLAAELVPKGVAVIDPRGEEHTMDTIGERLSVRDFLDQARLAGMVTGGPPPYDARARQAFAGALDRALTRLRALMIGALLLGGFGEAAGQSSPKAVEIQLASGTELERRGRDQLERLLKTYDLDRWTYTRTVRIESRVIPHSHPVLTLNTRYLEDDTAQVATYLHEQLHWFIVERGAAGDSAIAELRRVYPSVPSAPPEGARDEESTYLHLLVCLLELDATAEVFGEAPARRALGRWRHYTWVYREVLERPEPLRRIARAHGLRP